MKLAPPFFRPEQVTISPITSIDSHDAQQREQKPSRDTFPKIRTNPSRFPDTHYKTTFENLYFYASLLETRGIQEQFRAYVSKNLERKSG